MAHATVDCLEYVIFNDGCDDEKRNIILSPTTIRHILLHSITVQRLIALTKDLLIGSHHTQGEQRFDDS